MTKDDIVIFEAMVPSLDESWRRDYKKQLEQTFRQEEIMIRVQDVRLI